MTQRTIFNGHVFFYSHAIHLTSLQCDYQLHKIL